ncbi:hypothetical protein TNCV_3747471 [Trichonephila clavipes]|nr:hypothetical protein TNCV_3747471 [Trichonephila clavipes]
MSAMIRYLDHWATAALFLSLKPEVMNISHLDVSHNDLEDLEISKLYKLESLDVSQNVLKALNLEGSRLRTLQADGNGIVFTKILITIQFLLVVLCFGRRVGRA